MTFHDSELPEPTFLDSEFSRWIAAGIAAGYGDIDKPGPQLLLLQKAFEAGYWTSSNLTYHG